MKAIKGKQLQDHWSPALGAELQTRKRHMHIQNTQKVTHTYIQAVTHTFPACFMYDGIFFFLFCLERKYGSNDFSYASQTLHVGGRQPCCTCVHVRNLYAYMYEFVKSLTHAGFVMYLFRGVMWIYKLAILKNFTFVFLYVWEKVMPVQEMFTRYC